MAEAASTFPLDSNSSTICKGDIRQQVFAGIVVAIVVVGLLGNVLVFSTILILREYRKSVTNWYILQLALADTLFLLVLPFTVHSKIVGEWEFSLSLCKFKEAVFFINYYASIYFLVIMSFDRYLAVSKTCRSRKWVTFLRSSNASYIISVIGWILSVLLCIQLFRYSTVVEEASCNVCDYRFPLDSEEADGDYSSSMPDEESDYANIRFAEDNLYFYDSVEDDTFADDVFEETFHKSTCSFQTSSTFTAWLYGNFFKAFCLPFALICLFYGMILRTVKATSKVGNKERQRSYRRRVNVIVLTLVILFAVSWIPWHVERLSKVNGLPLSKEACKNLEYGVCIIAYLNSALNPYFYSFLGTHFRDRLKRAGKQIGLFRG